jgi:hypothetical protein
VIARDEQLELREKFEKIAPQVVLDASLVARSASEDRSFACCALFRKTCNSPHSQRTTSRQLELFILSVRPPRRRRELNKLFPPIESALKGYVFHPRLTYTLFGEHFHLRRFNPAILNNCSVRPRRPLAFWVASHSLLTVTCS